MKFIIKHLTCCNNHDLINQGCRIKSQLMRQHSQIDFVATQFSMTT
jgi:hypothetical protein